MRCFGRNKFYWKRKGIGIWLIPLRNVTLAILLVIFIETPKISLKLAQKSLENWEPGLPSFIQPQLLNSASKYSNAVFLNVAPLSGAGDLIINLLKKNKLNWHFSSISITLGKQRGERGYFCFWANECRNQEV